MSLSRTILPLLLSCLWRAPAQEVSWTPPVVYAEKLERHLTPVEPLMKAAAHAHEKGEDGVVIVDEELHLILPDARRVIVEHMAMLAVTDAGAEQLGRAERSFQKSRHRPSLVRAQTISRDGKMQPVKKGGAFIQTPQRGADDALYDDSAELVIIFPNVKAGCVTEWITVTEETRGRIPGEYTSLNDLAGGWPVRKLVRRFEMPDAIAQRMKLTPLGSGVPEVKRISDGGQTTLLWERSNVAPLHSEEDRAPLDQSGPCVFLTTLPDWNSFLKWYVPLADQRSGLDDKLKALADEWTKDAKSARETVDLLTTKVANDVRYVGLEFAECDLEPHNASEVWEHQYGDCKDKASLLVALLRHKGLTAYMVLVNTEHLGRVEKRSPDFRHFDHAIAVAMLPEGPLFIDATISGAPAGVLSPGDTDREVLLVKEPEQWLHTPAQRAGQYGVDFEATLAADGGLSGWVTLRAGGYIGTLYADHERTGTKEQVRQRLTRQAAQRWEEASVVDVKPGVRDAVTGNYELTGYFTAPAGGSLTLPFPCPAGVLPEAGETAGRETDLTVWLEDLVTTSTIVLPQGYTADLPPPVVINNIFAEGRAGWEKTEKGLKASLVYRPKTSRIAAVDVPAFGRMLTPLRAWMGKPLTISVSDKARAEMGKPEDGGLGDFPVMPTGEGQLNLVEEKFPDEGNAALRRKALGKTLALFPQDRATQFKGTVQLAWLDIQEDNYKEALRRLKVPLETGRGSVSAEDVGLAEYVQALALSGDESKKEALAIFERQTTEEGLSAWRRAWSWYQCAILYQPQDHAKAVAALQSAIALDGGNEADQFELLATFRLGKGEGEALGKDLKTWLEKKPGTAGEVLTVLAKLAAAQAGKTPRTTKELLTILEGVEDPAGFGEEFTMALSEARRASQWAGAVGDIAKQLKSYLNENEALLPDLKVPDTFEDAEAFLGELEKNVKTDEDGDRALRWTLEFLRRYPPDQSFSGHLRKAAAFENFREEKAGKTEPGRLLRQLLSFGDRLPKSDDQYWEGRLLRARVLQRSGKFEEGRRLYAAVATNDNVSETFRAAACILSGDAAVKAGNSAAALEAWTTLKRFPNVFATADCHLKAALLELEQGHADQAWEWIRGLRGLPVEVREKCKLAAQVKTFLECTGDPAVAEKWWRFSEAWWPKWEALAKKIYPSAPDGLQVPAIPSMHDLETKVGKAGGQGDFAEVRAGFEALAHAARWDPNMALELALWSAESPSLNVEQTFRESAALILAISSDSSVQPETLQRRFLYCRIRAGAGTPEYSIFTDAARFRSLSPKFDVLSEVVARLRAVQAAKEKRELAESAAEMEKVVETNEQKADRHINVRLLAQLYAALDRRDDEVKLLTSALDHPDIRKNETALKRFRERLEFLKSAGDVTAGITSAINAWFAVHKPEWLETAEPQKIGDADEVSHLLSIASGEAKGPANFKLATLVAADAGQPVELRMRALTYLAYRGVEFAPDEKTARGWLEALADKSLPSAERARLVNIGALSAYDEGAFPFVQWIATSPSFSPFYAPSGVVFDFCALPAADLDAGEALARRILDRPLNPTAGTVLRRLMGRLAGGGRVDVARKIAAGVSGAKFEGNYGDNKMSLQLGLTKIINRTVEIAPLHEALRSWWLKEFPQAPPGPAPEVFRRSREPKLDEAALFGWYDRQVRDKTFDPLDAHFWMDVMSAVPGDPARQEARRLAMLEIFFKTAVADADRGMAVTLSMAKCDMDNPSSIKAVRELVAPFRKTVDAPQTADALRCFDLALDLRAGKGSPTDWRLALQTVKSLTRQSAARMTVLMAIAARGDKEDLRDYLSGVPLNLLTQEYWLPSAIHAWRVAEMKEELEMGESKAREMLPELITTAWALEDLKAASIVLRMARALRDPSVVPAPFAAAMQKCIHDKLDRAAFTADLASLRGEWESAREASAMMAAERPTDFAAGFILGRALLKLGRKEEAVPYLKAYIATSPDELNWQEAKALLKEAEQP